MKNLFTAAGIILILAAATSCNGNKTKEQKQTPAHTIYKGLYSFGPEVKSFKDCATGQEFWTADSSAKLELGYSQMNFEKPYTPVYVEVEGSKVKSGNEGMGAEFDSTIIVKKVVKITKTIPVNACPGADHVEVEKPASKKPGV